MTYILIAIWLFIGGYEAYRADEWLRGLGLSPGVLDFTVYGFMFFLGPVATLARWLHDHFGV